MSDECPKTGTVELHSWDDFAKILKMMKAGTWIYRGHELSEEWNLASGLDRYVNDLLKVHKDWDRAAFIVNLPRAEFFAISRFREMVKKTQELDSNAAALIAMQHYGAKTRLLDFTMSIMVALFFAYENRANGKERAIYAVDYMALMNQPDMWSGYQAFLERMARNEKEKSGFDRESERIWWGFGPEIENHYLQRFTVEMASSNIWACNGVGKRGIIPLYMPAYNGRQMAQAGIELMPLTFEGFSENLAAALATEIGEVVEVNKPLPIGIANLSDLERLLSEHPHRLSLVKFVFDAQMEDDAWQILDQANINASTIYPDVEGIAKSVRYSEQTILGPKTRKRRDSCNLWKEFEDTIRQTFKVWDGSDSIGFLKNMRMESVDFTRLTALGTAWGPKNQESALNRKLAMATDESDVQFLKGVEARIKTLATIANVMIPRSKVKTCCLGDAIRSVVDKMLANSFSHIPVLDSEDRVVGVFSESTMLELIAIGVGDVKSKTIRDTSVLLPLEKHTAGVFEFVPKNDPIVHMRLLCDNALKKRKRIGMFFVTATGSRDEPLLGILTVWDIAGALDMAKVSSDKNDGNAGK